MKYGFYRGCVTLGLCLVEETQTNPPITKRLFGSVFMLGYSWVLFPFPFLSILLPVLFHLSTYTSVGSFWGLGLCWWFVIVTWRSEGSRDEDLSRLGCPVGMFVENCLGYTKKWGDVWGAPSCGLGPGPWEAGASSPCFIAFWSCYSDFSERLNCDQDLGAKVSCFSPKLLLSGYFTRATGNETNLET